MSLTRIIARIGWNMAAASPIVGPYVIASQRDDVQYVAEVTYAINNLPVFAREDGRRLAESLDEYIAGTVPVDWTAQS